MTEQDKEIAMVFSKNLRNFLNKYNMTQAELAKRLDVTAQSVTNWCKGTKLPRMGKIQKMSEIFNCEKSELIYESSQNSAQHKSFSIPVLGRVAAGIPLTAVEETIDQEEISEKLASQGEFFGLLIKGDSMEPRICDGDVVIVRKQSDADSGDLVIALINGEDGVCKRLQKYPDTIVLVSNNPNYAPMVFTKKEIEEKPVEIIGKVIELRGKM